MRLAERFAGLFQPTIWVPPHAGFLLPNCHPRKSSLRNSEIVHTLLKNPGKGGWLRAIFDLKIGAALKAMHERVENPWTVKALAGATAISRSAFALRFKDLLGETPLEYLTNWRMRKATALLQEEDKKLLEVAKSVGYDSDAAFSKAFKRVLGVAPGEYRRSAPEANLG